MTRQPQAVVQAGYNAIAKRYLTWQQSIADDPRGRFLKEFTNHLPHGTHVLELGCGIFDGVVALYSVSHTPRECHAALFERIARWLKPGALFLASLGSVDAPDWTGEWLGVPMFFSSYDADTNRDLLEAAGLKLITNEVVTMREPEGEAAFLWVIAQKPTR